MTDGDEVRCFCRDKIYLEFAWRFEPAAPTPRTWCEHVTTVLPCHRVQDHWLDHHWTKRDDGLSAQQIDPVS